MPRQPSPSQLQTAAHSQGPDPLQHAQQRQGTQTQQQGAQTQQHGGQAQQHGGQALLRDEAAVPESEHQKQATNQAQVHKLEQGNPTVNDAKQGNLQGEKEIKAEGHAQQQGPLREVSQVRVSGQGQGHAKSEGKGKLAGKEQSWLQKPDQNGQGHKAGQAATAPETRGHKRAVRPQAEPGTDLPKPKRIKPVEQVHHL